jgi:PRC-barrel domain
MIVIEDLRDWRGLAVITQDGAKIGSMEAVYFDTASQEPAFVSVRFGLPVNAKLVFVPLTGATVAPKHIRVTVDKKLARAAPAIEVDGELEADDEPAVYAHYGMPYKTGASGERRLGRR